MKIIPGILWHIPFFGFLSAFIAFMVGGLFIITIIGAPLGLGLIELAKYLLSPQSFAIISKEHLMVEQNRLQKHAGLLVKILYLPFGLLLMTITLLQIALLYISVVGIPAAAALYKTLGTYFYPVNIICIPRTVKEKIMQQQANVLAA